MTGTAEPAAAFLVPAGTAGTARVLAARGRWVLGAWDGLSQAVEGAAAGLAGAGAVRIEAQGIEALDTVGAIELARLARRLEALGPVEIAGLDPVRQGLLDAARKAECAPPIGRPVERPIIAVVERAGRAAYAMLDETLDLLAFVGMVAITLGRTALRPARLRGSAIIHHMEKTGLDALPIVGLLSFLIGVVLAYQGADQLRRFGAQLFVVNLVGISILREIGVLMTSIIVAGRSGSAFTAQIGTMQVNQEVDAMRTLGLDPVEILVLPRMIALVLALPLLSFYAAAMGLLGGAAASYAVLDVTLAQFLRQLQTAVPVGTMLVGLAKAPVFAAVIALVGCYEGLKVSGSADSVGRLTTKSVVVSIFLVIVLDALFSILFASFGL
ncbi:MlaE family ABC transporter permease [Arenibaculum pallidiluteum]|uniref:MlaE family ABC transporter permease n=1 Tax=Arenibaculum pallidiluteum TaxID=2812559 RepID=UPI001A9644BE|nr:MlaE family lipid ABC transporter permease subunit [Arenibaculum pallidiluteum]